MVRLLVSGANICMYAVDMHVYTGKHIFVMSRCVGLLFTKGACSSCASGVNRRS